MYPGPQMRQTRPDSVTARRDGPRKDPVPRRRKLHAVATFPKPKTEARWTPIGVLKDFLADVESGKIVPDCVMIFWVERREDGRFVPHYWTQNVTNPLQIGYGELIKSMALEDWKS